jgi:hypothetical protein
MPWLPVLPSLANNLCRRQRFNYSDGAWRANQKVAPRQYHRMTITLHALLLRAYKVLPRDSSSQRVPARSSTAI